MIKYMTSLDIVDPLSFLTEQEWFTDILGNKVNKLIKEGFGPDINPYSRTFTEDIEKLEKLIDLRDKKFKKTVLELDNGNIRTKFSVFLIFVITENKLVPDVCKIIFDSYLNLLLKSYPYQIRDMIHTIYNYGKIQKIDIRENNFEEHLYKIHRSLIYDLDVWSQQRQLATEYMKTVDDIDGYIAEKGISISLSANSRTTMFDEAVNIEQMFIQKLNYITNQIDSESYLKRRIQNSRDLQKNILYIGNCGFENHIDIYNLDFDQHLNDIITRKNEWNDKLDSMLDRFNSEYLRTRSWFMQNRFLQMKVFKIVTRGHVDKIYACSGNFEEHLDEIIDNHLI